MIRVHLIGPDSGNRIGQLALHTIGGAGHCLIVGRSATTGLQWLRLVQIGVSPLGRYLVFVLGVSRLLLIKSKLLSVVRGVIDGEMCISFSN